MTAQEKEMMDRYIYEVTRRLPKAQREEIRLELEELIGDMLESKGIPMEAVLTDLGSPAKFAQKYRGDSSYLIGPEYYDTYLWVLRIALICTAAISVAAAILDGILDHANLLQIFIRIITDTVTSLLGAFTGVTIVFAVFERQKVRIERNNRQEWTVRSLAPIPDKKAAISRGESVVGIIFIIFFGGLLIFAPQLFGVYVFEEGTFVRSIAVLNLERWNTILPILLLNFLIMFVNEVVRLAAGCYCKMVMVSEIITGAIQLFLSFVCLKVLPFWNPDFLPDVERTYGLQEKHGELAALLNKVSGSLSDILLAVICFAIFLEIGTTIYKTARFGSGRRW